MKRRLVSSLAALVALGALHARGQIDSPGFFATNGSAAVPERIHLQGRLVDGADLFQGAATLGLRLFDDVATGTLLHAETQVVAVVDGLYDLSLGAASETPGTLASALTNEAVYLEVEVNGVVLAPRERIESVAYALRAARVARGGVDADAIEFGAVTEGKVADGSLSGAELAEDSISSTQLDGSGVKAELEGVLEYWNLVGAPTGAAVVVSSTGVATGYSTLTQAWTAVRSGEDLHVYGTNTVAIGSSRYRPTAPQCPLTWTRLRDINVVGHAGATIYGQGGGGHQVVLDRCTNITFTGVQFLGDDSDPAGDTFGQVCLESDTRFITFDKCVWKDGPNHGILTKHADGGLFHAEDVTITRCQFLSGGATNHPTLNIDGAAVADFGSRWTISDCVVSNWARGLEIFVRDHIVPVEDIVISDTVVTDCYGSNGLMVYGDHSGYPDQLDGVTVQGCTFRNSRYHGAIISGGNNIRLLDNEFVGYGGTQKGIYIVAVTDIHNVIVRGNTIRNTQSGHGIVIDDREAHASNVIIEDNLIMRTDWAGIYLHDSDVIVRNNILIDCGKVAPTVELIEVFNEGGDVPTIIEGNYVANIANANTIGLLILASVDAAVTVTDNRFVAMASSDIVDNSGLAIVTQYDNTDGSVSFPATVTASAFAGDGSALTALSLDASGFDGNLTTAEDTLQEVAQAVDDLLLAGGGVSLVPPPLSASASGQEGQIAYDSNYFYVCVGTNTWVRAPLATW